MKKQANFFLLQINDEMSHLLQLFYKTDSLPASEDLLSTDTLCKQFGSRLGPTKYCRSYCPLIKKNVLLCVIFTLVHPITW